MKVAGASILGFLALVCVAKGADKENLFNFDCKADAECEGNGSRGPTETSLSMGECVNACNDLESDCKWFEWGPTNNCKLYEDGDVSFESEPSENHLCCKKSYEVGDAPDTTDGTSAVAGGISNSIADYVSAKGSLSTLAEAIDEAGLFEALDSPGSFTLFAPNNAAFNKMTSGTMSYLFSESDVLADVLLYHVLNQEVNSIADGAMKSYFTLLSDCRLMFERPCTRTNVCSGWSFCSSNQCIEYKTRVKGANTANVVTQSIQRSNGVIHIIDTVLDPKCN